MALKVDYVVKETAINVRRNISLTLASFLTVAVSLFLFGGGLLVREGVSNATLQWRGGIEFIVYLNPDVSPEQKDAVERSLDGHPEVERFSYVNQQEAYEEFKELFKTTPEMVDAVSPEVLPPSFRVVPHATNSDIIESVGRQFQQQPGVAEIAYAKDVVDSVLGVSNFLQTTILVIAIILLVASVMLIVNTIRMAMFARRREIEVMKLVGATNWFIRVPFMLEGLLQGLLGAGVAFALLPVAREFIERQVTGKPGLALFEQFAVTSGEVTGAGFVVLAVGVLAGTVGAGVAVSRFLDV